MNKLAVVAVAVLVAFVGWCGWLAYHYEGGNDNGKGLYAPNAMNRVRIPVPVPISPEAAGQERAIIAATTMRTDLQINGKQVVVSSRGNMLDPERHDMAHALARAEHSCTQTRVTHIPR